MTAITQVPDKVLGKDFHKFGRVTVTGPVFNDYADFVFNFRCSNMSFSLAIDDGYGTVEYSFNGHTVHGDLTVNTPTQAIFFDNRVVPAIWFRARTPSAVNDVVRIEGWVI